MSSHDTQAMADAERQKAQTLQQQAQHTLDTAKQQADSMMQQADDHMRQAQHLDAKALNEIDQEKKEAIKKAEKENDGKGVLGALF